MIGKQESDTNLVCSSFLESGKTHQITGFGCYPELACSDGDLSEISTGVLEFIVGGTADIKFKQPLMAFPNFASLSGNTNIESLNTYDTSQRARCIFPFIRDGKPAYEIGVNQCFVVKIIWPRVLTILNAVRLMVVIDGLTSEAASGRERFGIPNEYPIALGAPLLSQNQADAALGRSRSESSQEKEKIPDQKPERKKDKIVLPDID